jgi:putative ABC transport system ATP-binding protein
LLRLQNITKLFPSASEPILKDLALDLREGEFTVLIGGNGCGKSTLLKLIQGEHKPEHGTIFLKKRNITQNSLSQRAKEISVVSQDVSSGTVKELTLLENLVLGLRRGESASFRSLKDQKAVCEARVKELGLGLERFLESPMVSLSGGQKQMLAFVIATMKEPSLLLLDEPCSALDPRSAKHFMQFADRKIREHKFTTLMVTHSLSDALQYGERLIMLREGRLIFDVHGEEKKSLTLQELLDLYHHYEDSSLL